MTMYKVDDGFLDQIDALLDSVMEAAVHSDTLDGAGIVLVNMARFDTVKDLAAKLCDTMDDGFDSADDPDNESDDEEEKEDDENGIEEDSEECTDPVSGDSASLPADQDDSGCDPDAD